MKKRSLTYFGLLLLGVLFGVQLQAQTNVNQPYNGPANTTSTVTAGGFFNYYDNNGPLGTYTANSNPNLAEQTFAPSAPGRTVVAVFSNFATENSFDVLYVYDGSNDSAPKIASANGTPFGGTPPSQGPGGWSSNTNGPGGAPTNTATEGTVIATNGAGSLTFTFRSDGSVQRAGWTACVTDIPSLAACAFNAPADNLNLSTDATSCSATLTTSLPTGSPACLNASGAIITYSVDGGMPVTLNQPYPASVIIPGLAAGAHTITWTLSLGTPCGDLEVASDVQNIFVSDQTPPVVNCPNDIFVNLDAGECNAFVNYTVTATDNCPFIDPQDPVQFPASFVNHGSGQAFSLSGNNAPGGVYFNLTNNSGVPAVVTGFGIRFGNPAFGAVNPPQTMQVFSAPTFIGNETNAAAWTNLGPHVITMIPPYFATGTGALAQLPLSADVTIPPGETRGFHVFGQNACPIFNYFGGAPGPLTNGPFTCQGGPVSFGLLSNLFQAGAQSMPNIQVNYALGGDAEVTQTEGLPSGSNFPLGTTTNCFETFDVQGNQGTCCFDVTVVEFPNPTNTLACNDLVQISLDETCSATIGADDILEGGPYRCYDTGYTVNVLSPLGASLGNTVNGSFIGQQWTVRVTDNITGQSCWGKIIVEDKLDPVVICSNINLPCNADVNDPAILQPSPAIFEDQDPIQFPASFANHGGGQVFSLAGNTQPGGYYFDVTNESTEEISVTGFGIRFGNPQFGQVNPPQTLEVWTADTYVGNQTNMAVWTNLGPGIVEDIPPYFATGTGPLAQLPLTSNVTIPAGEKRGFHVFGPTACPIFNYFGGATPSTTNGILTLEGGPISFGLFGPLFQGPGAISIPNIQVNFAVQGIEIPPTDNCGVASVTHIDNFTDGNCGGPSGTVVRTWTVTDNSGNTDVCNQIITIERPTLDDIETPLDITWSCLQYDAWPNIITATPLHPFLADCDPDNTEDLLEMTCYTSFNCNDNGLNVWPTPPTDNPAIDNTVQGPCNSTTFPQAGLENQDVFAVTGSGVPSVDGNRLPLASLCEIGVNHADITIEVCPGTFKIIRKWTLIDWCSNPVDVREINQVVKVVDETAPTITAPADLTIAVYNASIPPNAGPHAVCHGTVVVPAASGITDDCSGVAGSVTELWTVNAAGQPVSILGSVATNGGAFFNIPLYVNGVFAKYLVRYYATDGCGNQGFDDTNITVRDKVPPVAVCDEITEVSITNNGLNTGESCSTLHAASLDDGSYDNCAPVYFLMAKMDDSFSQDIFTRCYYPSRDFCCDDIGEQTVILLVLDGNPAPFFTTLNSPALGCDGTPGLFLTSSFGNSPTQPNYNVCMVTVQVTDKLNPILISCPANTRRTCDWYADNLETQLTNAADDEEQCDILSQYFGTAEFFDNCSLNINCNVNVNLDQCLEGTISRSWTAQDDFGNNGLQACNQTINIDHVSDWVIEFPADVTVTCGNNVPDFGEPEIFFETCELVAVSFDDEVYTTVPDACYKIVRQWTVINWCVVGQEIDQEVVEQPENALGLPFPSCDLDGDGDCDNRTFRDSWRSGTPANLRRPTAADATRTTDPDTDFDSDPWDGYITYQQVIKVIDNVDPVFANGCQIPDVCILDNTCGATLLLPTPGVDDCVPGIVPSVQVTIGGAVLNGYGPYLNVAPGTYPVRYVAMDNCNNQTDCQTTVTVRDCKKPTPYCKNGLVIELMNVDPAMVQVWANDFNDNSFDNCPGALKFSFSSNVNETGRTYTCADLGQQPVQIWVTDAAGNQDFCETFVIIQGNMGQCDIDPLVAGVTATETDLGVEGVNINVNSPSGFNADVTTDVAGAYSTNVAVGGDYTITPVLDVEPLNGVSTFDLVLISKHILGVQPLGSPYKIIAADANKSNSVTTFDLVEIRKLILFINTDFPNNTSWRFFDANCNFANASNPFASMCSEVINLNDVSAAQLATDFVAVKVGDVNGSAATNLLGSADDRTMVGDLVFNVEDIKVQEGDVYTVDFKATDFNVSGYQFTLNFDRNALDFVEVVPGLADASNFGLTMVNDGVLTASWNGTDAKQLATNDVVFSLTFKAKQSASLSSMLSLNSRYTVAEAYNADAQLLNVALSFNNEVVANGFELFQNTPNPFASATNIGFYLPEATSATLTISDVQGKVVFVQEGDFAKGYNQVELKRGDLNATGVLYYRLDTANESATLKMILVD